MARGRDAWDVVWAERGRTRGELFGIFDCARRMPATYELVRRSELPAACLLGATASRPLHLVAPWCVHLSADSSRGAALVGASWGESCCLLVVTKAGAALPAVGQALEQLLWVELPSGKRTMFRYFDPRVFRRFVPTCDRGQWNEIRRHFCAFSCESADAWSVLTWDARGHDVVPTTTPLTSTSVDASRATDRRG